MYRFLTFVTMGNGEVDAQDYRPHASIIFRLHSVEHSLCGSFLSPPAALNDSINTALVTAFGNYQVVVP